MTSALSKCMEMLGPSQTRADPPNFEWIRLITLNTVDSCNSLDYLCSIFIKKQLYVWNLNISCPKTLSDLLETLHDVIIMIVMLTGPRVIANAAQVITTETTLVRANNRNPQSAQPPRFEHGAFPSAKQALGDPARQTGAQKSRLGHLVTIIDPSLSPD